MKRKDRLLLHILPATLAIALAAAPVLAQSPGSAGGASGNTGATGTDTRSSTQGSTGTTGTGSTGSGTTGSSTSSATTPSTTPSTTPGSTTPGSTMSGTTGSTSGYGTSMANWPADSVIMHRPRLSQLIGTNVYNDRNETIGEVDDVILATPAGMGTTSAPRTGTTAMGAPSTTTTGTTGSAPSGSTTGSTTTGTTTPGGTTATTLPGISADAMHGPVAIIQVGGFLGMGGRLVAVPLSELHWNTERERIIMPNASKETLQGRPAFSYDALRRG